MRLHPVLPAVALLVACISAAAAANLAARPAAHRYGIGLRGTSAARTALLFVPQGAFSVPEIPVGSGDGEESWLPLVRPGGAPGEGSPFPFERAPRVAGFMGVALLLAGALRLHAAAGPHPRAGGATSLTTSPAPPRAGRESASDRIRAWNPDDDVVILQFEELEPEIGDCQPRGPSPTITQVQGPPPGGPVPPGF